MKIQDLQLAAGNESVAALLKDAELIATRTSLFCSVALYQTDYCYIEVFYQRKSKMVSRVRTFHSTEELNPYLSRIDITGLMKG